MSIYLERLDVTNFKSFPPNKMKVFDFKQHRASIFDGPNGYGKSTVFDSVELLITGNIKHFNSTLKNGFQTSLAIVANSSELPTKVVGIFSNGEENFSVSRIFKWEKGRENHSEVLFQEGYVEEKTLSNEEVYSLLNISQNFFEVGMYISQSDSLLFLQEKYKKRKDILTSILDMDVIENRNNLVKEIKSKYSNRRKKIGETLLNKQKECSKDKETLQETIDKINLEDQLVSYTKLFPNMDFSFDRKEIDVNLPIDSYKKNINKIKTFVVNYELYKKSKINVLINKLLAIPSKRLKKYYYKTDSKEFEENQRWWEELKTLQGYVNKHQIVSTLQDFIEVKKNEDLMSSIENYYSILEENKILEQQINEDKKEILRFNEKRSQLYNQYIQQEIVDDKHCPFCGKYVEDLINAYKEFTDNLEKLMDVQQVKFNENTTKADSKKEEIIANLNKIVSPYSEKIALFQELKDVDILDSKEVAEIIEVIPNFNEDFLDAIPSLQKFEKNIEQFNMKLNNMKCSDKVYNEEELVEFDRIYNEIFNNEAPHISVKDLEEKYLYIQSQFQNIYQMNLRKAVENLAKVNNLLEKHDNEAKRIDEILSSLKLYNNGAYLKYQNRFIEKIQLPLFLISGRILQTYQLGLGIYAEVNNTQVVFKVAYKDKKMDTDIFNILSVGQLNGVILAILFAIRKVYSKENQLDLIMIDDPLQSIDEISAHSFADLLIEEFPNTQLILSTHEEDKSRLIRYKYQQVGKKANNFNMQVEYLKS